MPSSSHAGRADRAQLSPVPIRLTRLSSEAWPKVRLKADTTSGHYGRTTTEVSMDSLIHDIKVGRRLLWKDRSFTATVAVTLAVCIGANVALFSIVNNVLLRPLPMPDSGRIAIIGNAYPKVGAANLRANAVPDYFDRRRETTAFEE